jgi:hypothetical protein
MPAVADDQDLQTGLALPLNPPVLSQASRKADNPLCLPFLTTTSPIKETTVLRIEPVGESYALVLMLDRIIAEESNSVKVQLIH